MLNQTIAEENDTLLAAQSVQTMIDDTAAMIAAADKDTAIIMQKAGPVLQDTLIRTQEKLQAKTLQRQEAEALLQRLEARQKCFTYLIAKAERLFRERNLDKLQARLRCDIYADESYLLQLDEEKKQLQQQLAEQKALLDEQTLLLQLAQEHYNAAINEERELRSKAQQDFICAKEKGKQALADIDALVHAREQEKADTEQDLTKAKNELQRIEDDYNASCLEAERIYARCRLDIAAAEEARDQKVGAIEEKLSYLQQIADEKNAACEQAHKEYESLQSETDFLQRVFEQQAAHLKIAQEQKQAAQDALKTATQMAEKAAQIRSTLNEESSGLLLQAHEVLMEAVNSAQSLLQEKLSVYREAEETCSATQLQIDQAAQKATQANL